MYFEEFQLGMCVITPRTVIEKEKMIAFAKEYDNIPLHTDEEYAKGTRFGGLIAPGVMSFMSVWTTFCEMGLFGDELVAGKSTRIEWLKPVYAGDVLVGRVTVTALTPRGKSTGLVEVTVDVTNQNGDTVLQNVTESILKRKVAT